MKELCITAAKAVGFFVGWAVLTGLLPLPETENAAIWRFWAELIPFLSAAGWTVLFWLPEKRKLRLHLIASPLKSTLIGLGAGFLWLKFRWRKQWKFKRKRKWWWKQWKFRRWRK